MSHIRLTRERAIVSYNVYETPIAAAQRVLDLVAPAGKQCRILPDFDDQSL
jgi:hypothetical protein